MKNFGEYVLIMMVFFIAALAFLEVDKRCGDMYGTGGKIASEAAEAASAAVRVMEAAASSANDMTIDSAMDTTIGSAAP